MQPEDLHIPDRRLRELCVRYGVSSLALFGSRARGDARPDSDVDLLVTFLPNVSVGLVHLGRLQAELEVLLGARVDLVPRDGLKPLIRDSVLGEARALFAA
jgi:predicted nucleotidyltransferase